MAFEMPHKHDLAIDGQTLRGQMIENFEAIEQEDQRDDKALADEIEARNKLEKRVNHIEDLLKLYGMTEEGTK